MKYHEINKEFSLYVQAYLEEGYMINTQSLGGSQGEVAKVDLYKGDELIRIWIEHESSKLWGERDRWHGYTMVLRIGRWNHPAKDAYIRGSIVWMSALDVICERTFYEISNDWYVETEEEAVTIQNLHRDRYYKHSIITSDSITSEATKDIAVKYLKRKLGYQRVSRDKIGINKNYSRDGHHTAYYINYNGHCYRVM